MESVTGDEVMGGGVVFVPSVGQGVPSTRPSGNAGAGVAQCRGSPSAHPLSVPIPVPVPGVDVDAGPEVHRGCGQAPFGGDDAAASADRGVLGGQVGPCWSQGPPALRVAAAGQVGELDVQRPPASVVVPDGQLVALGSEWGDGVPLGVSGFGAGFGMGGRDGEVDGSGDVDGGMDRVGDGSGDGDADGSGDGDADRVGAGDGDGSGDGGMDRDGEMDSDDVPVDVPGLTIAVATPAPLTKKNTTTNTVDTRPRDGRGTNRPDTRWPDTRAPPRVRLATRPLPAACPGPAETT